MSAPSPQLSVLIATHERREKLHECLAALAAQTQDPADFEVIVADDGSTDGSAEALATLQTPFALRVLQPGKVGKSAALNGAIEVARGSVCLFIDDDVIASPELVAEHLAAHRREPRTLGIGALIQNPAPDGDPYAVSHARRWNERYAAMADREVDWADCYGGNFSAPRATLSEVGGFDTDLPAVEDLELGYRLSQAGCAAVFLPDASAVHDDHKLGPRLLADEQGFGGFCAAFVAARPETSRRLIGWLNEPTAREVGLRKLLLAVDLSPRLLISVGRLIPARGRRDVWFGFVSRYAFWRGVRKAMGRSRWRQTSRGVPVLMYHAFTEGAEEDRYVLSKSSFARQMRLLAALRYHVITLEELARLLREQRSLPRRTVVVTIDDGYRDSFEIAHPILLRHRLVATVYLVSARIGAANDWGDKGAVNGRPLLDLDQIERMQADGTRFGAHTRTHRPLPSLPDAEVSEQVGGSRTELESALGEDVATFTYPYGAVDQRAVEAVRGAGFLAAATTVPRPARLDDDPLLIPRIEIKGEDSTARFLRKLWLGGE